LRYVGVDFDNRCQRYRVRLTRDGFVFHLGHFDTIKKAAAWRSECEEKHRQGKPFDYVHRYVTPARKKKQEVDGYLFKINCLPEAHTDVPERNLLIAILIQAIKDATLSQNIEIRTAAHTWFAGTQPNTGLFSFNDVCEELGIGQTKVLLTIAQFHQRRSSVRVLSGRRTVQSSKPKKSLDPI